MVDPATAYGRMSEFSPFALMVVGMTAEVASCPLQWTSPLLLRRRSRFEGPGCLSMTPARERAARDKDVQASRPDGAVVVIGTGVCATPENSLYVTDTVFDVGPRRARAGCCRAMGRKQVADRVVRSSAAASTAVQMMLLSE